MSLIVKGVPYITVNSKGEVVDTKPIQEHELPTKTVMAKNAAIAAHAVAMNGFKRVDKIEYNRRHNICFKCELYRPSDGRCAQCGCFVKIKASLQAWKCPVNKW